MPVEFLGIAAATSRLRILLAHRPNIPYPTYAAQEFAVLDQRGDFPTKEKTRAELKPVAAAEGVAL
ncbi:hypothetical protein ABIA33_005842 [Streptacidiphilus sp. MAP12-16]|uniref:hypothetical protein n=1 Tax=Streptacidiphilus sp. MAP12-16 TaxID=3156300 RepID=UPI003512EB0D